MLRLFFLLGLLSLAEGQDWVQWDVTRGVPNNQMPRGRESDYKPLYVIRATFNGDLTPGKYNADWGQAFVSYGGYEQKVTNFEVNSVNAQL